jgi:RimJ/RimL family protein N-acetyltransferase
MSPAVLLQTPRLELKRWCLSDAPAILRAVAESRDHLRRWMAWAEEEPVTLQIKRQQIRKWRRSFRRKLSFNYGIRERISGELVGAIGLHARIGEGALEIGYWVHARRIQQGIATEAAAGLTRAAFELHRVRRVEIHCDPLNLASAGIPRKLAYRLDAIVPSCLGAPDASPRDTMFWSLSADAFAQSPSAAQPLQAFSAPGTQLI